MAAVRLDAYGLLYCLILALLLVVSETHRRRLWPVVVIIVAICISVQYTLLVGAPPTLCYFSKHGKIDSWECVCHVPNKSSHQLLKVYNLVGFVWMPD